MVRNIIELSRAAWRDNPKNDSASGRGCKHGPFTKKQKGTNDARGTGTEPKEARQSERKREIVRTLMEMASNTCMSVHDRKRE